MGAGSVRVRFAPSPTGYIHVGNARTALFNYLYARRSQGAFVLRIEDTDAARSRPEYEQALIEDLRWLGLAWDEGPDVGGPFGPYRQSERLDVYREHLEDLLAQDKAYACFCLPEELEARRKGALAEGKAPAYDGRCARLSPGEVAALEASGRPKSYRYRIPGAKVVIEDLVRGRVEFDTSLSGDPVIWKSDGFPTFHFSVTVDDALMRVTCVLRGEGHLPNAPIQVLLARDLAHEPPQFAHMSQTLAPGGGKISKRRGGMTLRDFREDGVLPEALANYIALLGWSPRKDDEFFTLDEAAALFDIHNLTKSPAYFDLDKFAFLCRRHMQAAAPGRLAIIARPFLREAGFEAPDDDLLVRLAGIARERAASVSQFPELLRPYLVPPSYDAAALEELRKPGARDVLLTVARVLEEAGSCDQKVLREAFESARALTGLKGSGLYMPARIALTGTASGPEITEVVPVLGGRPSIDRLRAAATAASTDA